MSVATQTQVCDRPLFIGGSWRPGGGGEWLEVLNPADESVVSRHAVATATDLDEALAAAQTGFETWRQTTPLHRSEVLRGAAALIRQRLDPIARDLTREQGKPLAQARMEIEGCARHFEWAAEEGRRAYGRVIPANQPGLMWTVTRHPVGPVAAFTPWNFPASQAAGKIGSALAAGCSMILKGPEDAPGGCIALAQALADAGLPAGVLNLVFGRPAEISAHLIASPIIRKVSFTGSVPVGKLLAQQAAGHMKPCTMELGGHAPVMVFADMDPIEVAQTLVQGKFRNAGQVCISPTRFYVEAPIYDQVVEAFVAGAEKLVVGDGLDPRTEMGPLAHDRRLAAVEAAVIGAVEAGAQVRTGGERLGNRGYFYRPTVLTDAPETAAILHEEPFGPIAILSPFTDRDEAMARANGTAYGLAAYAFTRSQETAAWLGRNLEAGMVGLNTFAVGGPEAPFGGVKESGYGREGGMEGIDAYLTPKVIAHLPL
ncbi:NAD-dependent succinate-semialdehyde dehydrogenase [Phenylobacterium sp.]|uniref:NAD-dependent succinate-semialdehyde dehydrogenase n=3 Tax=Phenylobacterium sp. TaxID=1871053 RepID=UPI00272F2A5B|nr:NAD-dependent succinate-semialdehyde dehydrogenase [Phenylobacterium sp.]MDP1618149.1 NAD-dependent succinate-semialdehyde dehydrogenase [Phenylobacterium sp.]